MPATDLVARAGPGRRRARPGGRRRAGRLRELLVSGVIDSFGMALGWTVVVLMGTARGGLAEAALYNAAMLVGAVLSAPVTGWLAHRFDGRTLLRGAAGVEAALRFAVLGGLIAGAPSWSIAAAIVVMFTAAWASFAGMRAEVTAVDASPRSMTRYVTCIMGVEAAGTALAALLPSGPGGYPTGWMLTAVFVLFAGSVIPTILTARRARITPVPSSSPASRPARRDPVPAAHRPAGQDPFAPAPQRAQHAIPHGPDGLAPASRPGRRGPGPLPHGPLPHGPLGPLAQASLPVLYSPLPQAPHTAAHDPLARTPQPALHGTPTPTPQPALHGTPTPTPQPALHGLDPSHPASRCGPGGTDAPAPASRPPGRGRHALVPAADTRRLAAPRLLLAGGAVMLLAAGPTMLAVPVIEELHGGAWVAGSAVAFCLGTLFGPAAVTTIERLRLPAVLRWSLWGLGMLIGWILAPTFAPMVLAAQFAAGLAQTAFEGDMDARVAAESEPELVTRDLAYAASVRALGGAVAVRMLPVLVAAPAIGLVASSAALILGIASIVVWTGLTAAPHLFRRLAS